MMLLHGDKHNTYTRVLTGSLGGQDSVGFQLSIPFCIARTMFASTHCFNNLSKEGYL